MDNRTSHDRRQALRRPRPTCRHAWRRRMRMAHRVAAPALKVVLPAPPRPEASLRQLADRGATPRQMLWGIWWCHTLPALCRIVATVLLGSCVMRELRTLL